MMVRIHSVAPAAAARNAKIFFVRAGISSFAPTWLVRRIENIDQNDNTAGIEC